MAIAQLLPQWLRNADEGASMAKRHDGGDPDAALLSEDLRRAISRFVRAVRSDADTPHSAQSETLALLERAGAMNIASLARLRKVTHQTMRLIVGQLEGSALVLRTADPADRRSQFFSITKAGIAALARERAIRTSRIEAMLRAKVSREEQVLLRRAIAIIDRMSTAAER